MFFFPEGWIITGGMSAGVMEFIGQAVKEHVETSGDETNIVAIGIASWGAVANNSALDGEGVG
jgi:transient receptor potential cation channel subfamily M protein 2